MGASSTAHWKLRLASWVGGCFLPLAAALAKASAHDATVAPALREELPLDMRFVLGCIFVYQVALWYRAEHGLPLNVGMKAFLRRERTRAGLTAARALVARASRVLV